MILIFCLLFVELFDVLDNFVDESGVVVEVDVYLVVDWKCNCWGVWLLFVERCLWVW